MFEGRKYTFRSKYGKSKDIEWASNAFLSWKLIENKQAIYDQKYFFTRDKIQRNLKKDMGT